jgi:hypothetical protein
LGLPQKGEVFGCGVKSYTIVMKEYQVEGKSEDVTADNDNTDFLIGKQLVEHDLNMGWFKVQCIIF